MKIEALKTFNWLSALRGMRNPLQSWNKFDTEVIREPIRFFGMKDFKELPIIGENDLKLSKSLATSGGSHAKFLRQIFISCNVTAPLLWWVEYDTYKVGTVANSTSKMFKLGSRKLTQADLDFDTWEKEDVKLLDYVNSLIEKYLELKKGDDTKATKAVWRKLQQVIPSSFVYERTITLNYEVLRTMYKDRKKHKLDEWRRFLDLMVTGIPYGELFIIECNRGAK